MSPTRLCHFAGGVRIDAHTTRTSPVFDPASGRHAIDVPLADAADIECVIADAHAAAPAW
jgi:malonate-semialdehyde dehydrogenase (acetylating)/methylmalonate-semialdehyde dehydrogenase